MANKRSEKQNLIEAMVVNATEQLMEIDSDDDDANSEIFDELEENISTVLMCRRGVFSKVPKSTEWCYDILTTIDEDRFRQMLRVERHQFEKIVNILAHDEEFTKVHASKQFPVELQVAIVLFRLGSSGESASIRKIAAVFGVGDGGTLANITRRVFKAILRLQHQYIFWPNESERAELVAATMHELPYCVGYVDGTEIKLAESPISNHTTFFSRKHIYSLKAQVVCDHKLGIRNVVVGHPGSWHDARIFRNSSIFKRKEQFLSPGEWIAGDSAYPLSEHFVTPYRNNARQMDRDSRIAFNLRHSTYRVRIEHCFGILKERFGSLKELRMRLHNEDNHNFCCESFLVCCILHNILVENSNESTLSYESTDTTENDVEPVIMPEIASLSPNGELKRQEIFSMMFHV